MPPAYVVAAALAFVAIVISRPAVPAAQVAVVFMIVLGVFSATLSLVFIGMTMAAWAGR